MAIPITAEVDLLYKKLYGVAKTDTPVNKSPSNEAIPSPALNRGDTQWTQSNQIPGVAAAVSGIVQAYTGSSAVQCTADNTCVPVGGIYPTWLTGLTGWIPQEFGPTYVVQAWVNSPGVGNPTVGGTQIFSTGSGGTGEWFFDYEAGLLNFIGGTIPASLTTGKVIYIIGYRYVGLTGVTNLPSIAVTGNIGAANSAPVTAIFANGYYYGNGVALGGSSYSNADVANYLPIFNGNILANNISIGNTLNVSALTSTANITSTGNIVAVNFIGGAATLISTTTNAGINLVPNGTGNVNVNSTFINNVTDPVASQDAATKNYVDSLVQGLQPTTSVAVATAAVLPPYTYIEPNGAGNGIGAYLEAQSNGALTIDGNLVVANERVLIKNETAGNAAYNGLYTVTVPGDTGNAFIITRAVGSDQASELYGQFSFVTSGNINAGTGFVCTNNANTTPITFGTTAITYTQFSGAGSYSAGPGITQIGSQFSAKVDNTTIAINGCLLYTSDAADE